MTLDDPLPAPLGVRVARSADDTRIVCYWFSIWAVGTLAAAGFFVYALVWLIDFLKQAGGGQLESETFGILLAVICGLVYYGTASVVNSTTIIITTDEVRVRHGPLPWLGGGRAERRHVVDVTYRESIQHCQRLGVVHRYYVDLILRGGCHQRVLSGFYSRRSAVFVHDILQDELLSEVPELSVSV